MMEAVVRYTRHLLHSSSAAPVVTFWLAVVVLVTFTSKDWISHGEALAILMLVAVILIVIADKRDVRYDNAKLAAELKASNATVAADLKKETQAVSSELSGKVAEVHDLVNSSSEAQAARIQQLIEVIQAHDLAVPPPEET